MPSLARDFAVLELTAEEASRYLCDHATRTDEPEPDDYFATTFRLDKARAGDLGLHSIRENGGWRIIYRAFES